MDKFVDGTKRADDVVQIASFGLDVLSNIARVGKSLPLVGGACGVLEELLGELQSVQHKLEDMMLVVQRIKDVMIFLNQLPKLLKQLDPVTVPELETQVEELTVLLNLFKNGISDLKKGGWMKRMLKTGSNIRKLSKIDLSIKDKLASVKNLCMVASSTQVLSMMDKVLERKVDYKFENEVENVKHTIEQKIEAHAGHMTEEEVTDEVLADADVQLRLREQGGIDGDFLKSELSFIVSKLKQIESLVHQVLDNQTSTALRSTGSTEVGPFKDQYGWAVGFSREKLRTTFEAIFFHDVTPSNAMLFYFTSSKLASMARASGIPAKKQFNGIPLSSRYPHDCTDTEFAVFSESSTNRQKFPNEQVLVLSIPKQFLEPLPGYEEDNQVFVLPVEVFNCMRPVLFDAVHNKQPWLEKQCLLPPQVILRSYLLIEQPESPIREVGEMALVRDISLRGTDVITPLDSIVEFTKTMSMIRLEAMKSNLIPLYHYTSPSVAPLILKGGLRMSTEGQGDGGVYVTTQGPASYGIGSADYEVNIIKDCFGASRIDEYLGKGNLDVILVYGCGRVLEQVSHDHMCFGICSYIYIYIMKQHHSLSLSDIVLPHVMLLNDQFL